jgi:hypothetical protein
MLLDMYVCRAGVQEALLSRAMHDTTLQVLTMEVQASVRIAGGTGKADVVSKVVDRVLTQIFGDRAARLIYRHLERNYSLKPSEIADKVDVFAKGLEDFLSSGAFVVERRILDDLQSSCGLDGEPESAGSDFVDQVRFLTGKS